MITLDILKSANVLTNIKEHASNINYADKTYSLIFDLIKRQSKLKRIESTSDSLDPFLNKKGELTLFIINHILYFAFIIDDHNFILYFNPITKKDIKNQFDSYNKMLYEKNLMYNELRKDRQREYSHNTEQKFNEFMDRLKGEKPVLLKNDNLLKITDEDNNIFYFKITDAPETIKQAGNEEEELSKMIKELSLRTSKIAEYKTEEGLIQVWRDASNLFIKTKDYKKNLKYFAKLENKIYFLTDHNEEITFKVKEEVEVPMIKEIEHTTKKPNINAKEEKAIETLEELDVFLAQQAEQISPVQKEEIEEEIEQEETAEE